MYSLSEQQIEFIRNDIRARGVTLVSLQQDLLDHVCCMVECDLEPDGDFEGFYSSRITQFYNGGLREIEEETIALLTLKNYYVMKKIMLFSGVAAVGALSAGLVLKFLHLPGAAILIFLGVIALSLIFLPLLFTLKIKEETRSRDKAIIALGTLAAILISFGILFKIMHWPGANMLGIASLGLMLLVFLPVYFFTGIRNPEAKVNTIVSSVFIVYGCALVLMLIRSPQASQQMYAANGKALLRSEKIFLMQQRQAPLSGDSPAAAEIVTQCDALMAYLLEQETGSPMLDAATLVSGNSAATYFDTVKPMQLLAKLDSAIARYNGGIVKRELLIEPVAELPSKTVTDAINELIQVKTLVFQNQAAIASVN